ncbi:hypothetical protein NDU88_006050 [Pleurodeles waltl]|uniref:KRAB domain-containing protein n=1 Tax=Pleurodeles waltl TaxID=8319 RepID=A0AAV7QMI3_PLEWA|nr:hypothetical protein NDU88_006050 [Pleurodeles waltl]
MSQPEFDEEQVKFQDVAVCFSEEEWKVLQEWQKDFYKNVMKEIHQTVIAMGYQIVNTGTLLRIHKGKDIYIQDLQDTVTADTCNQTALSHPTVNPDVLFRIAQTEDPYCRDEQCPREKEVSNSPGSCFPIVTSAYSLTTDEELELCSTDHQGSKQRSSHHAAAHGTCEANEYGSSRTQAWSQGSKSSSILHITRGLSRQLDEQNERTTSHNERTSQGYPFCQTEVCLSDEDEPPLRLRGHPDEDVESSSSDSSSGPLAIPDDDIVKIKEEEEEDIYFVDHKDSEIMERISNLPADGGSKRRQRKFAESVQSIKTNAPSRESLWEKTTKVLHASYMGLNSRRQMRSESYQEMKRDKNLKAAGLTGKGPCDGPVGDGPCTKPTSADTAPGAQEQPGAGTNERYSSAMTSELRKGNREEGVEKRSASATGEEESGEKKSNEEESGEEESGEQEKSGEEIGERFLPSRGEEDEEAADGGLHPTVALEGKTKNPATLLEKRGTSRCVTTLQ